MKISTVKTTSTQLFTGLMAMMMIISLYSCAKKTTAAKSETAAATEAPVTATMPDNKGQVQIKRDVNSNYVIQINLQDLKEISTLDPNSKNAYIVWMNADGQAAKNLGQINSNTGWLTDKSKATFEAVTPIKPTKIYITSETSATVKAPGKSVIWSTSSF